jgi:hypothetical protein
MHNNRTGTNSSPPGASASLSHPLDDWTRGQAKSNPRPIKSTDLAHKASVKNKSTHNLLDQQIQPMNHFLFLPVYIFEFLGYFFTWNVFFFTSNTLFLSKSIYSSTMVVEHSAIFFEHFFTLIFTQMGYFYFITQNKVYFSGSFKTSFKNQDFV